MKYVSLFSGIEAATAAWHEMGWRPVAFSEIEPFPCSLLAQKYPNVPNEGDVTKADWAKYAGVADLLVGGSPCQAFSVAGLRNSLGDERGNLTLEYVRTVYAVRPRWVVWENVPGVLSTDDNAFGAFLAGLSGHAAAIEPGPDGWSSAGVVPGADAEGYGLCWRVLDAQYFGVAQRRRRVFVVGRLGDWRAAAAVLFEPPSLRGNTAPRRQKGQGAAGGASRSFGGNNTAGPIDVATAVNAKGGSGRQDFESETFALHPRVVGRDNAGPEGKDWRNDGASFTMDTSGAGSVLAPIAIQDGRAMDKAQNGLGLNDDGTAYTVDTTGAQAVAQPLAFKVRGGVDVDSNGKAAGKGFLGSEETAFTLAAAQDQWLGQGMAVRRLTPRECERLQGFPDDYTAVQHRGKPAADGPRYKALGNSMAVPVMRWIGRRIAAFEAQK